MCSLVAKAVQQLSLTKDHVLTGVLGPAFGDAIKILHIADICSVSAVLVLTGRLATARSDWPWPRWTDLHGTSIATCASSYKRVKGRSHTVEKRKAIHPQKPHATSQPSRFSHTPRLSTDAAHNSHSYQERPIHTSHHDISTGTAKPAS